MKLVLGILAHVDAGKTTFSEQLLYHTRAIRKPGRVDHQDAFMDHHPIERERGITIFSDQAVFEIGEDTFYLVDTPGHVDFSSETERSIQVMDAAVIVVSGVEGVQSHTETLWKLLRRYGVPTLVFINKTDREGADVPGVMKALERKCSSDCLLFTGHYEEGLMETALAEAVAERDEALLEVYLDEGYQPEVWQKALRRLFKETEIFPVFVGSALNDTGIEPFIKAMTELLHNEENPEEQPFSGQVYKILHDSAGSRLSFVKVTAGRLRVKDEVVTGEDREGRPVRQKINEIRIYSGGRYITVPEASPGDLCAVTGLSGTRPGDGIGENRYHADYATVPLLTARVIYDEGLNVRTVLEAFKELEDEDPMLEVLWSESLQEIHIHIMGAIQLEVLEEIVRERFGLAVRFGDCEILYKETIAAPVTGYGHFEPLRHYAEVHLRLEPAAPGAGIIFDSACSVDILDANYQNLIKTHVFEREHRGVLTGSPITDMRIVVVNGRAHLKHTEGGDFRQAVYRAIRQGLEQAESILLEPVYRFEIDVPSEAMGRVMSDVQKMAGRFEAPELWGDQAVITGFCPVASMMNYSQELLSFTKGRGLLRVSFSGYEPCHNAEAVILRIGYDKKHDVENTSDSVFCSHGAGFNVPWDQVEEYIHCK
ncbi:TetM/TetW/TetO/TetS family tetracycline resistance ribosomal protection protein [Eubacterium sp. 1001713B170207_170306_E7]|uniref:elongation factor G n=1 Tax=Eubacterium sp. 1001713B170207_170306_E7 TaxID=2787097 RepID=UPI00189ABE7F|nr:TetM/TetW/TetO/TetS family tetracycline resistance ribosomal protection protein [Eubacterium sp. 1001713B170207_170306_E7]